MDTFKDLCILNNLKKLNIYLTSGKFDVSINYNEPIRWASENGYCDVIKLLLQFEDVNPADWFNSAIRFASSSGHLSVVNVLLSDPRVDPGDYQNDAIRKAVLFSHYDVVERLLKDPRVDPSQRENEALFLACKYGDLKIIKLLLSDDRVNPNDKNNAALDISYFENRSDIYKCIVFDKKFKKDSINPIDYLIDMKNDRAIDFFWIILEAYYSNWYKLIITSIYYDNDSYWKILPFDIVKYCIKIEFNLK